ncbi:MAG: glucans biosynthesis glucosyltransferase MdoH, partial [Pirellulaceae bacterium]
MSDITERLVPTEIEITSDLRDVRAGSEPVDLMGQNSTDDAEEAAARWAVAEYLRDLGLRDPAWIARETESLVRDAQLARKEASGQGSSLAEAAVARTVHQLDQWLAALARSAGEETEPRRRSRIVGARLPDLLSRYPHALNPRRPDAEMMNTAQRDLTPVVPQPRPRPMRRQKLTLFPSSLRRLLGGVTSYATRTDVDAADPVRSVPRPSRRMAVRLLLATLTFLCTSLGTWLFANAIAGDGFGLLDFALSTLFAILFLWVAFSFWTATLGLFVILRSRRRHDTAREGELPAAALKLPPTAIVMPVYNEDPQLVFANVRAIAQSLHDTGEDGAFHVFVLSDTTDPDIWLEEERSWARFVADLPGDVRVFYRHRPQNTSRKAGNIADFCSRWGDHYRYMIVLDADSVMAGSTLVEMVRRMEQDPQLGILQVPPRPVNRQSVFARMQQFAASFYGPIFLEGFALWSECDGNYWGHNAIIRIRPFMEHCELPILPGDGPLSGEILSHDFVEAALMRRAGWKVCLAHDLEGSYEECPTTILDFAQRDQRWCQGNLQHIRLLLAEGLHPASRLHFGMGAMSYLASPLWLSFLVLTMLGAMTGSDVSAATVHGPSGILLFLVTMALLLLPKVWSVLAAAHQSDTAP